MEKLQMPVLLDGDGNPIAIVFFHGKTRERTIFMCHEADEEEIISLFNKNNAVEQPKI